MPPCHASRRITHGAPSTSTTAVLTVTSFRNVTFVRDTRHRRPRARMRSVAHRPAVCCPAALLHMLVPSRPHAAAANSRKGGAQLPSAQHHRYYADGRQQSARAALPSRLQLPVQPLVQWVTRLPAGAASASGCSGKAMVGNSGAAGADAQHGRWVLKHQRGKVRRQRRASCGSWPGETFWHQTKDARQSIAARSTGRPRRRGGEATS